MTPQNQWWLGYEPTETLNQVIEINYSMVFKYERGGNPFKVIWSGFKKAIIIN